MADGAAFCAKCGAQQASAAEPGKMECAFCHVELWAGTKICPKCRKPQPERNPDGSLAPPSDAVKTGQIVSLVGGVMLAVGPFLPWAKAGLMSADGMQKTDSEALVLVGLGVVAVVAALVAISQKKRSIPSVIIGIAGGGLSALYYVQCRNQLDEITTEYLVPSIGYGLYVCILGSIAILIGGLVAMSKPKPRK